MIFIHLTKRMPFTTALIKVLSYIHLWDRYARFATKIPLPSMAITTKNFTIEANVMSVLGLAKN